MTGLIRRILGSRLIRDERGGVALVMVAVFLVMAVPLTKSAFEAMQGLSQASLVYD